MIYVVALAVGVVAGTHIATWGMYKDAPHEGFRRYFRSIFVGAVLGPLVVLVIPKPWLTPGGIVVLFGVVYACERGVTEFYKTFVRNEDQSKYFIPMQFHVFGRVIPPGRLRVAVAAGYVLAFAAVGLLVQSWGEWGAALPRWARFGILGTSIGWLVACGGAFKDAPIEGFEWLKFFRSPVIAGAWAAVLSPFTGSHLLAAVGGAGYSVATIETYKTFFFPHRPRGKFAGKPVAFPEQIQSRQRFIPLYAGIWLIMIATILYACATP